MDLVTITTCTDGSGMKKAATITGDRSGIVMDVYTEEPGLQFYSGHLWQVKHLQRRSADAFNCILSGNTTFPRLTKSASFRHHVNPGDTYKTKSLYQFQLNKIRLAVPRVRPFFLRLNYDQYQVYEWVNPRVTTDIARA